MATPAMNFPAFWDAFGGSIFADEYRGDFLRAQTIYDEHFADEEDESTNTERHGRALLYKLVLETLKGNEGPALDLTHKLARERPKTDEWNRRGILYSLLVCQNDILIPYFSFAPDPIGWQRMIYRTEETNKEQVANLLYGYCKDMDQGSTGTDFLSLERALISMLRIFGACIGKFAPQINPRSPEYNINQLEISNELVRKFDESCAIHARNLDAVALRDKAMIPRLRRALVLRATGTGDPNSVLNELIAQANTRGDRHGVALCSMHKADNVVSTFSSHIVFLNLILVEGTGAGLGHNRWDTDDGRARVQEDVEERMEQTEAAQLLYAEALAIANDISATRLVAAIHLRQGCLMHLAYHLRQNTELDGAIDELNLARQYFRTGGDETGCQLVNAHLILAAAVERDTQQIDRCIESIIEWYQISGYRPFMHYLGLLIARFGYKNNNSPDLANLCFGAARKLFDASNHPLSAFQIAVEQYRLLQRSNDETDAPRAQERRRQLHTTLNELVTEWNTNPKLSAQPWYTHMIEIFRAELGFRIDTLI